MLACVCVEMLWRIEESFVCVYEGMKGLMNVDWELRLWGGKVSGAIQ